MKHHTFPITKIIRDATMNLGEQEMICQSYERSNDL